MRSDTERRDGLLLPWVVLAMACLGLMLLFPGGETVSYHVGWIALGLAYGLYPWPLRWAITAVIGYAAITGVVLVDRALRGIIPLEETTEIPLMAMLVICMIWHVNQRVLAFEAMDQVRRAERDRAERRELMAGLVSHEIKTTVTIASGYLDLVVATSPPSNARDDVQVARDELHRLSRASERLIRMMRMQEEFALEPLSGDGFMAEVLARWSAVAQRDWQIDPGAGLIQASPHRLRACFDTLIENSLRHTRSDGTIRLVGVRIDDQVCLGVADSGTGFSASQLESVNQHRIDALGQQGDDARSHKSGLGLAIVDEVVREHGGRLVAGRSAEGGALVLMVLPTHEKVREPAAPEPLQLAKAVEPAA
ncbi:signal transduction histidine kinase [Nocardioides sp. BE266]|uniref:sensor histidine kinase n=1 Tax=Nocardioides sp. BE266 TaxID=2817725 RepID=UPI00285D9C01|nr:HAMP domain-containing sensor histidine kinase [Nocardioides sp. BE266]MDR7253515.1 signal transduction histidine kinase [Nocardioides sp. BE266]